MADHLDDIFRKKLRDRHFSPEAGDWIAMEKKLNSNPIATKGSNLGLWLFFSFLTSLIIIGTVASMTYNSNEAENKVQTELLLKSKNEKVISNEDKIKGLNTSQSIPDNTIIKNESSTNYKENTNKEKSESVQQHDAIPIAVQENSKIKKTTLETQNSSVPLNKTEKYKKPLEKTSESSLLLEANSQAAITDRSEAIYLTAPSSGTSNTAINSNAEAFEANDQMQLTSGLGDNSTIKTLRYGQRRNEGPDTDFNSLYLNSIAIHTFEDKTTRQNIVGLRDDYSDTQRIKSLMPKRKLPIQLSIAAFGEVAYVMKKITGDNEFASLIRNRNEEEKNILSVGGGIEVQAKYKQWSISTGFSSTSWGENIQYEEKYNSEWEVTSTVESDTSWTEEIVFTYDTVYNPVDSTIYIYVDSSFINVIDSIYFTTVYDSSEVVSKIGLSDHNGKTSISYWEIPLYFTYQFDVGDFYLTPGLGITIGFLKITRGHYLAKDLESLIEINSDYAVVRKTLLNGQINLGVGYRLGDRFSIEATPAFRFNLSNIFEDPGIIQRYKSLSLQLKLRYYF